MIARTWRGWSPTAAAADAYERHFAAEVATHLREVPGFRGARLLRHPAGDEVMFTTLVFFDSMEAVRAFAGDTPDQPVLEDEARRALTHWDDHVTHHEVVADLQ